MEKNKKTKEMKYEELTVKQIKAMEKNCNNEIAAAIKRFEELTDMKVMNVAVDHFAEDPLPNPSFYVIIKDIFYTRN